MQGFQGGVDANKMRFWQGQCKINKDGGIRQKVQNQKMQSYNCHLSKPIVNLISLFYPINKHKIVLFMMYKQKMDTQFLRICWLDKIGLYLQELNCTNIQCTVIRVAMFYRCIGRIMEVM